MRRCLWDDEKFLGLLGDPVSFFERAVFFWKRPQGWEPKSVSLSVCRFSTVLCHGALELEWRKIKLLVSQKGSLKGQKDFGGQHEVSQVWV